MFATLFLGPASSAHQDRSGRAPSLARSLPSPSPSQIPRDHVAPERAAHGSRATETPPSPGSPVCPRVHSAFPAWGRARLLNESQPRAGLAVQFSSALHLNFFFLSGSGWCWDPSGAGWLLRLRFCVDATADAADVPFQRMPALRRVPEMFSAVPPEARVGGSLPQPLSPPGSLQGTRWESALLPRPAPLVGAPRSGMGKGRRWGQTRDLPLPTGCFASLRRAWEDVRNCLCTPPSHWLKRE